MFVSRVANWVAAMLVLALVAAVSRSRRGGGGPSASGLMLAALATLALGGNAFAQGPWKEYDDGAYRARSEGAYTEDGIHSSGPELSVQHYFSIQRWDGSAWVEHGYSDASFTQTADGEIPTNNNGTPQAEIDAFMAAMEGLAEIGDAGAAVGWLLGNAEATNDPSGLSSLWSGGSTTGDTDAALDAFTGTNGGGVLDEGWTAVALHSDSMPDVGDYASAVGSTAGLGVALVLGVVFAFLALSVVIRWVSF